MMKEALKPFDRQDEVDALADLIRIHVANIAVGIFDAGRFSKLPAHKQIEAFVGGGLTAVIGVAFAMVANNEDAHDAIESFVTDYVPQARALAESIASSNKDNFFQ